MKLQDKVVFITDGENPSGRAILKRFAAEGASFVINCPSNDASILDELEPYRLRGSTIKIVQIDLCSSAEVTAMLDRTAAEMGSIDILIHNNHLVKPASVEYSDEGLFYEMLNTNAKTAFVTTQLVGKQMSSREKGKIVFIGSIHAEKPTGSSFIFSAAKGAVQMLSREASLVLGRFGVNVNHIQLGPTVGDDLVYQSSYSPLYEDYEYKIPNAILGTFDDLANLALFLVSDEARYINGADIRIDGGFLNHYLDVKTKKP